MAGAREGLRGAGIGEIVKKLSQETSTLVRQEMDLAKAEMAAKARQAGMGAGLIGAALVVVLAALGALVAFLVLLAGGWSTGARPFVAGALLVLAAALAVAGRRKLRQATPPVPEQTVETVKEDVEWAKTQISSAKR